jgi:uncharacterized protein (TIGR00730 family)
MTAPPEPKRKTPFCVTVFGSSSSAVHQSFKDEARALGKAIADAGYVQCNGGGRHGLMGAATDGALENGGAVDMVILRMFCGPNMHPGPFRETAVEDSMAARKGGLFERADAFIALPGGLGTLEELSEVASWRQLELHDKPIILVNTNSFYTDFWCVRAPAFRTLSIGLAQAQQR